MDWQWIDAGEGGGFWMDMSTGQQLYQDQSNPPTGSFEQIAQAIIAGQPVSDEEFRIWYDKYSPTPWDGTNKEGILSGFRTRIEQDRQASSGGLEDSLVIGALLAGGGALVGSGAGLLSGAESAIGGASAVETIPELGMVADSGTAAGALDAGINLSGGAGAITETSLADTVSNLGTDTINVADAGTETMGDDIIDWQDLFGEFTPEQFEGSTSWVDQPGGAMDMFGSIASPNGEGLSGTIFEAQPLLQQATWLAKTFGPTIAKSLLGASGASTSDLEKLFGGASGGGILGDLLGSTGSYQFPWGDAIASVLGYQSNNAYQDKLFDYLNMALERADPFYSQRPQYQQMLPGLLQDLQGDFGQYEDKYNQFNTDYRNQFNQFGTDYNNLFNQFRDQYQGEYDQFKQGYQGEYDQFQQGYQGQYDSFRSVLDRMFNDPNYWANDSLLAGFNEQSTDQLRRRMSASGYNMSGNEMTEIAKLLQGNMAGYASQQQQNYGNYAGNFLQNYSQTGLGELQNYGTTGINRLNNLSTNNTNMLNNFSQTGLGQLQNFGQTGLNSLLGFLNYINSKNQNVQNVGQFAGGALSQGSAGNIASQMGMNAAQSAMQGYGNLGQGLSSIFQGSQPNYRQQLMGSGTNKSLFDSIGSWFN